MGTKIAVDVTSAIARAEKVLAKKIAKRDALDVEITTIQARIAAVKAAAGEAK